MKDLLSGAFGLCIYCFIYILPSLGWLYWLFYSIKIGSFGMFIFGVIPLTLPISIIVGAWGVLFGLPNWIYTLFG